MLRTYLLLALLLFSVVETTPVTPRARWSSDTVWIRSMHWDAATHTRVEPALLWRDRDPRDRGRHFLDTILVDARLAEAVRSATKTTQWSTVQSIDARLSLVVSDGTSTDTLSFSRTGVSQWNRFFSSRHDSLSLALAAWHLPAAHRCRIFPSSGCTDR
jgi:hypothetical protein